jgi:hypothetical protein
MPSDDDVEPSGVRVYPVVPFHAWMQYGERSSTPICGLAYHSRFHA